MNDRTFGRPRYSSYDVRIHLGKHIVTVIQFEFEIISTTEHDVCNRDKRRTCVVYGIQAV